MAASDKKLGQEQFVDGMWEWAGEINAACGALIQWSLSPSKYKGRLNVVCRALNVVDGRPAGIIIQSKGEWPNGDRISLEAYMMRLAMDVDHQLGIDGLEQNAETSRITNRK